MATDVKIQRLVHYLEHGRGRWWVGMGIFLAAAAFLVYLFLFRKEQNNFKGLTHQHGMEQAVIARELAKGNGFSTKIYTPAAIYLIEKSKGRNAYSAMIRGDAAANDPAIDTELPVPDIYHAPLWPWINSLALRLGERINDAFEWRKSADGTANDFWAIQPTEYFPVADRFIAFVSTMFFLMAVVVNYFIAARLFDKRLALIGVGLLMLCDHFWQFSFTGLPQMVMLFFFSIAVYCLIRAVAAQGEKRPTWGWCLGAGAAFGLLGLTHAITIWLVFGAVIYLAITFRPWGRDAAIVMAVFCLFMAPWTIRTFQLCGGNFPPQSADEFFGLSWQSRLFQIGGTESQMMRTLYKRDDTIDPLNFRSKIQAQFLGQMDRIYFLLGKIPVAPLFFLALIQVFKRRETAAFRWGILLMLLSGIFGMCLFGFNSDRYQSNDLYLLFIPLCTFYGLAIVLMTWARMEMKLRVVNTAMLAILFLISIPPLVTTFTDPSQMVVAYPPYAPGAISKLNDWYGEKDVICTDMPWAVAWYADRKCLWLPMTMQDFYELNDFRFNGRVTGLLLTPETGNRGLLSEVSTPEFAEWSSFIMRQPNARASFPLQATAVLPFQIRRTFPYILFSDRDRWSERGD